MTKTHSLAAFFCFLLLPMQWANAQKFNEKDLQAAVSQTKQLYQEALFLRPTNTNGTSSGQLEIKQQIFSLQPYMLKGLWQHTNKADLTMDLLGIGDTSTKIEAISLDPQYPVLLEKIIVRVKLKNGTDTYIRNLLFSRSNADSPVKVSDITSPAWSLRRVIIEKAGPHEPHDSHEDEVKPALLSD